MNFNIPKAITVLLLTISSLQLTAGSTFHALFFCNDHSESEANSWSELNNLNFVSFNENENAVLIESSMEDLSNYPEVCFSSVVRKTSNHLAFSRNELIIRIKPNTENDFESFLEHNQISEFEKHSFIPNQYLIKNVAKNEEELERINKEIKGQSWFNVSQINTVHTISVTSVNDPLFERQWAIKNEGTVIQNSGTVDADMQVDSAWNKTTANGIKIAILDSGVDTLHEDLVQNIFPGFDAFSDNTQNTFGYPTPNYSSDGHGTACAGIAAAAGNNSLGIAGVAYSANIIPIRIFYYFDYGAALGGVQPIINSNAQISGSAYAWREANADIMSTSAGLPDTIINTLNIPTDVMNAEINDAFNNARNGKGIAMFFSSGNENNEVIWPARLENTIAVGASTMCDERKNPNDCSPESWGSCYGANLDFVAPGVRITTTDMTGSNGFSNNDYTFTFNGTSAACPNAAGVGALVLSVNPNLHARDVRAIMSLSADKVNSYQYDSTFQHGSWNNEVGYGRVNAYKAVQLAETYNSTVGINEGNSIDSQLKVYPNPSSGNVFISNNYKEQTQVLIFNIKGKQFDQFKLYGTMSKEISLPKGIYFVTEVQEEKILGTKKLIIY